MTRTSDYMILTVSVTEMKYVNVLIKVNFTCLQFYVFIFLIYVFLTAPQILLTKCLVRNLNFH